MTEQLNPKYFKLNAKGMVQPTGATGDYPALSPNDYRFNDDNTIQCLECETPCDWDGNDLYSCSYCDYSDKCETCGAGSCDQSC